MYLEIMDQKLNAFRNEWSHVRSRVVTACRICFQEIEGSSQCEGHRNTCSGYSTHPSWPLPFRDDTDRRTGGCQYQWKIECQTGV